MSVSSEATALAGDRSATPRAWLRPVWFAAGWTILLRAAYTLFAALVFDHLYLDPRLVSVNTFADRVTPFSDRWSAILLGVWERFDTLWYVHLAQNGYDRPAAVVYYPLYPALIRVVSAVIHPPIAAALLISTVAAFFFFWGLLELLELDFPRSTSIATAVFMGLWPTSYILLAGYTEPLVMALSVWSIYFGRKERWWLAGGVGLLAGAAKAVGGLVVVPLAVMAWRGRKRQAWPALLCLVSPLSYALWLRLSGRPGLSEVYPRYWGVHPDLPWNTLADAFHQLAGNPNLVFKLNFGILLVAIGLVLLTRMPVEYRLYALAVFAMLLTMRPDPTLHGIPYMRYVLPVFPAFCGLARLARGPLSQVPLCLLMVLLNGALLLKFFEWSIVV